MALLRSGKADASGNPGTFADLIAAIAALPSWGGTIQLAAAQFNVGAQPILLYGRHGVTLDLNGAHFISTAQIVDPQLLITGMIVLQNCTDCIVKNGTSDSAGFSNTFVGLEFCTDCTVSGCTAQNANMGFGQFASLGGVRNSWIGNTSRNSQGTGRGFWLGGAHTGEIETDILIQGNKAINNLATGIAVGAIGARILGNLSVGNQGAGIVSDSSTNSISSGHIVAGNACHDNLFWGWQSDVWNNTSLADVTLQSNIFLRNKAGSALLNLCQGISYGDNIEDGIVQVVASSNGKVQLNGGTLATNGAPNTRVTFS
jgi:hypothetical protein